MLSGLVRPGGVVIFSDSLERPYKVGHQSELCARLEASGFQRQFSSDLEVNSFGPDGAAGVAAGRLVRVIVFMASSSKSRRRGA